MPPALANFLEITSILLMYFMASDYFWNQFSATGKKIYQYLTGIMQGAMGILLITKKVEWLEYYTFDARAVLLCLTGLVFGRIPAMTSTAMMAAFTIFYAQGTTEMLYQLAYTISIPIVALTILHRNPKWQQESYYKTIIACTLIAQAIIYITILLQPSPHKAEILTETIVPVWLLIGISNISIGSMLHSRVLNGQLQKELIRSETKFQKIALCSQDSFWELDSTGIIKYVTGDTMSFIGYTNDELIGIMPHSLVADSESINVLLEFTAAQDDKVFNNKIVLMHKRGYKIYCEARGIKTFDAQDRVTGFIGIIRNCTEEHLHEVLMRNNEKIIREQNTEFRKMNEELRANNKQIKETNRQLTEANSKVKEAQAAQIAFMTNIGHELLSPISDITRIADSLYDNNLPPEQRPMALQYIKEHCEFMTSLISDITDIDIINKGLLKIKLTLGNVDELMADLYDYHHYKNKYIYKKPIQLKTTTDLQSTERVIRTDFVRLKQILSSLITNAYAFTNSGKIWIRCQQIENSELQFSVSDTGIGIPANAYPHIFSPYNHPHMQSIKYSQLEHTGLGLSICKSLVEMLGGRIWFESEEGKGTTFYFTIPYIKATETGINTSNSYNWRNHNLLVAGCSRLNNVKICNKILNTGARFCNFLLNPESTDKTSLDTSYFKDISLLIVDQRVISTPGVISVLTRYPNAPIIITQENIDINALCSEIDQKLNAII